VARLAFRARPGRDAIVVSEWVEGGGLDSRCTATAMVARAGGDEPQRTAADLEHTRGRLVTGIRT
jgi:hypothetical protein